MSFQPFALHPSTFPNTATTTTLIPSPTLLDNCTSTKHLYQILPLIIKNGFHNQHLFHTKLINLFFKYGTIKEASRVFESVEYKQDALYHAMLKGYAKNSTLCDSLKFYNRMQKDEVRPVVYDFAYLLQLCGKKMELERGREIHGQVIVNGFDDNLFSMIGVMDFYVKCGEIDDAYKVFERMSEKDLITWTSLVAGYAQTGFPRRALDLFFQMQEAGEKADWVTLVSVLPAVGDIKDLRIGKAIHGYALRLGFESKVNFTNALLYMYFECGCERIARLVFEGMSSRCVVSWNTMIDGYAQIGKPEEAFATFLKMLDEGVEPTRVAVMAALRACADLGDLERGRFVHDLVIQMKLDFEMSVMNSLISMYSKCKRVDVAASIFDNLRKKTNVTWNTMIDGYAQIGKPEEAFATFLKMLDEGVKPTQVAVMAALHACADLGDLERGRFVHGLVIRMKLDFEVPVMNSLISMYSKCKRVDVAASIFDNLKKKTNVTWNAMILGYAQNGRVSEALSLFCMMQSQGIKLDCFTLVAVITALADLSVNRKAKWIHGLAVRTFMDSDVFVATALVDMYAKCGAIETARKLFDMMQERHVNMECNDRWIRDTRPWKRSS